MTGRLAGIGNEEIVAKGVEIMTTGVEIVIDIMTVIVAMIEIVIETQVDLALMSQEVVGGLALDQETMIATGTCQGGNNCNWHPKHPLQKN